MSIPRIYQNAKLTLHESVMLDEKASHHLSRVLRVSTDDQIILFNGDGNNYHAIVSQINKKHVASTIQQVTQSMTESTLEIHLAQGIARGEKMDTIVQKAVELGVSHIFPLITERCNVRLDQEREIKRLEHWRSIAISACEQSGRSVIPEIVAPQLFARWLENNKPSQNFVLSPHVTQTLSSETLTSNESIALLIGPEGGLSDHEINQAVAKGFKPLNLGPRILRAETATLAALTVMQYQFGDLR